MRRTVFVSFDYDNDRHYKYLLEAWNENPRFRFVFADRTPREIDSFNVGRIKAGLTSKIKDATHTLVIIGTHANDIHPKSSLIGHRNWINFEVHRSVELGNRIAAVKLRKTNVAPEELLGVNASWAYSFTEASIINALECA